MSEWNSLKQIDIRGTKITPVGLKMLLAKSTELVVGASPSLYPDNLQLNTLLSLGAITGYLEVNNERLPAVDAISRIELGDQITGLTWPAEPGRGKKDTELLNRLSGLSRLSIGKDVVPKLHYPMLVQIASLRHLDLRLEPNTTSDLDSSPIGLLKNLESLTIKNEISKERLQSMAGLTNMQSFHYLARKTRVSIVEVTRVFPKLIELQFPDCSGKELNQAVPNLEFLETLTLERATAEEHAPALVKLKKLKRLNVRYLNEEKLETLKSALPTVIVQEVPRDL